MKYDLTSMFWKTDFDLRETVSGNHCIHDQMQERFIFMFSSDVMYNLWWVRDQHCFAQKLSFKKEFISCIIHS